MTAPFIDLGVHHNPRGLSDRVAFGFTKALRWCADTFFAERYGHRAVVLETVAAVPGMVGATINHLACLRRMCGFGPPHMVERFRSILTITAVVTLAQESQSQSVSPARF